MINKYNDMTNMTNAGFYAKYKSVPEEHFIGVCSKE